MAGYPNPGDVELVGEGFTLVVGQGEFEDNRRRRRTADERRGEDDVDIGGGSGGESPRHY
jgi:hypothetical protein